MEGHRGYQEQAVSRAYQRNRLRPFGDRLFGRNLTTAEDVLHEEALWMNEEVDRLRKEERVVSATQACEVIDELDLFPLKDDERIRNEELARAAALGFDRALKSNNFERARKIFREELYKRKNRSALSLYVALAGGHTSQKATELVKSKDGHNLTQMFYELSNDLLLPKTVEGVMRDELRAPEIQDVVKRIMLSYIPNSPGLFACKRDFWVRLGVFDVAEVNQMPEVQTKVKEELIRRLHENLTSFVRYYINIVEEGIITANAASQMSEVQNEIKRRLILRYRHSVASYESLRDPVVRLGLIEKVDADAWVRSAIAPPEVV